MTQQQFSMLTESQKINEILLGDIVNFREDADIAIMLYSLHGFYVEVCFDKKAADFFISMKKTAFRIPSMN